MEPEFFIVHQKNINQLYKLSQSYAIHNPDLSRFYYDQFMKYLQDLNIDSSKLSHKSCGKCCNVFIPGVTCRISEEQRKNMKLNGILFDWSFKDNKKINFVDYTTNKCSSILIYECSLCKCFNLYSGIKMMKDIKQNQYIPPKLNTNVKRKREDGKSKPKNKKKKEEEKFDMINQSLKELGLDLTL